MGAINHEKRLRLLLLLDGPGAKNGFADALRRIGANPFIYVPIACRLANDELPEVRDQAAALLKAFLASDVGMEIYLLVLRHLPSRCPALASIAVTLTKQALSALQGPWKLSEEGTAELLNNLSERLAEVGDSFRALECARDAVARFERLAEKNPAFSFGLVTALNTLAKRLAASGNAKAAIETAEKAVERANRLPPSPDNRHLVYQGRSMTCLANRLSADGQDSNAIPIAIRAVDVLMAVGNCDRTISTDRSMANLACANILIHLGRFEEAKQSAEAAQIGFGSLAADDPGQFWDCLLAALNAWSVASVHLGETKQDVHQRISRTLTGFDILAAKYPHLHGADLVANLVSQSATLGELGDRSEARALAELAVTTARSLRSVLDRHVVGLLEGQALNNLFNRRYELGDFSGAREAAAHAVRHLRPLAGSSPTAQEHLARALRNLAEGLRMMSQTPAECRRAVRKATEAVQNAGKVVDRSGPTALQLVAQCHSTLSQCRLEADDIAGAVESEMQSLEIRRRLFSAMPKTYRRDLAFSLRLLAGYEISRGDPTEALRLVAESIRYYRRIAQDSEEDLSQHEAEALRIRALALVALDFVPGALRSFRAALDLLLAGYERYPDGVRDQIVGLLPEYVRLLTDHGLELEPDLVEWVQEQHARLEVSPS